MKKTFWLLACFGIFYAGSCHKDDGTTDAYVKGTVVNIYDSKPQPNADVYLVKSDVPHSIVMAPKPLDSTKSDNFGHFRFNYKRIMNVQYAVRAKHAKYFYTPSSVSYTSFGTNISTDSLLVGLFPKSFYKVDIKDTSRTEKYKGVRFIASFFELNRDFFSYPLDTTIIVGADYKGPNYTWYLLYENNTWGAFNRGSLICLPFDTCKIEIKF